MRKIRFTVRGHPISFTDVAHDEGDFGTALTETIIMDIRTELQVEIGGVMMHLSAWEDPEHWADEWAHELGVPSDDVSEAVEAIIDGAQEDDA